MMDNKQGSNPEKEIPKPTNEKYHAATSDKNNATVFFKLGFSVGQNGNSNFVATKESVCFNKTMIIYDFFGRIISKLFGNGNTSRVPPGMSVQANPLSERESERVETNLIFHVEDNC
jgi:hypothetical protein